jgi:thiol-disulfide isomerase/thioredoxin
MRRILLSITFLSSILSFGQSYSVELPQQDVIKFGTAFISGQIVGAANETIAFGNQNLGGINKPLKSFTADKDGKFSFSYDIPFPDYYFLKFSDNQMLNVILHGNDSIKIYGDLKNIVGGTNFIGSKESQDMNRFLVEMASFKKLEDSLRKVAKLTPPKGNELNAYFAPIAQSFYQKRDKFISIYANSPAPVVTLNVIDQTKEWELYQTVVAQLEKAFPQSPTIQNMKAYMLNLKKEKDATAFLNPGNAAKEIALNNPEGKVMKLSDLKGKVVLIDFWASWCRPCRAENPNVVKLYSHYKAHGFEVYSVSLDANLDSWKLAIEQDGLVWPNHVSDLKKWQNAAARDYGVKSIPFTVLIDAEGKVIGTNLRGTALENQLKTIFGH